MVFSLSSQQQTDTKSRGWRTDSWGWWRVKGKCKEDEEKRGGGERDLTRAWLEVCLSETTQEKWRIVQLEEKRARLSLVAGVYSETSCFLPIKGAGDCFSTIPPGPPSPPSLCSICLHSLLPFFCNVCSTCNSWSFKHLTVDICTCVFFLLQVFPLDTIRHLTF